MRSPLRVAAIQCVSHPGDIPGAVAEHAAQIAEAASSGAVVVLFPELSLTGYEPDLIDLHRIRIAPNDPLLQPISSICRERKVHAFVGAPTADGALPRIGVLHIDPRGGVRVVHTKQRLAVGEIGIFSAGQSAAHVVTIGGWKLALSLGDADADAHLVGAMYVIGSEARIDEQMRALASRGRWVVLAQYSGGTGGGPACGLSGGWRPDGSEVIRLGAGPGIAVVELSD